LIGSLSTDSVVLVDRNNPETPAIHAGLFLENFKLGRYGQMYGGVLTRGKRKFTLQNIKETEKITNIQGVSSRNWGGGVFTPLGVCKHITASMDCGCEKSCS